MRRALPAVLLLVLASCSAEPEDGTSGDEVIGPAGGTSLAAPPRPKCAEVFVPGRKIVFPPDEAAKGCADPDGGLQIVGVRRCADGGHLFNVDAATGAPKGWGLDGQPYHASSNLDTDAEFGKAYDACNG
jgi:hypothetical protein